MRLAERIGPEGRLIGLDLDGAQLERTARRLAELPARISLHHNNFAELPVVMQAERVGLFDVIFADLGVSSMQIDDPSRGIGYAKDGPLDMRMDTCSQGSTGADLLRTLPGEEIATALAELSDEPDASRIAAWIVNQRQALPIDSVQRLVRLVLGAKGLTEKTWKKSNKSGFGKFHPAARTFQALRILVNRELESLEAFLAVAPDCLAAGGRLGIISFQPGEDHRVRAALADGLADGTFCRISHQPITPSGKEIHRNWRSSSARFRWAVKAETRSRL
jgi:16S rRNA (cytosine1402-N4)-methyltransferase